MSNGFFSKIGRALSIFGVSSPDDVRRMQAKKAPATAVKPEPAAVRESSAGDASSQEKRIPEE